MDKYTNVSLVTLPATTNRMDGYREIIYLFIKHNCLLKSIINFAYLQVYLVLISYFFSLQELEIKKMAKSGNREACKILAKQLVQLRKQKNRTYAVSSKVTSMSTQTKVMNSQMKMAGAMSTSAKVKPLTLSAAVLHVNMSFTVLLRLILKCCG